MQHLFVVQRPDDPIRAAAEQRQRVVAQQLYRAWLNGHAADGIVEHLLDAWRAGYSVFAPIRKFKAEFVFNRLAPENEQMAADWAAQMVREVSDDIRVTLNAMQLDAVRRGLGPEETARTMRESVGLTAFQARAVQNYRRALEQQSPKALSYRLRDRRFDAALDRPLSADKIDTMVQRYRDRYLSYRANTIARYETLFASNAGALAAVQSSGRPAVKRWLLAPDEKVCARCRSVIDADPDGVPLNQPFHSSAGTIQFPPLHPSCRCTVTFEVQ